MNKLQKFITEKLAENKSYRRIGEECGINHVSIAQYHKGSVEPDGKNLALLGEYFHVDFWELLQPLNGPASDVEPQSEKRIAVELRLIVDELQNRSPIEQLEWLLRIRREKEAQKLEQE